MKTIDVQVLALKAGLLVEEVEGSGETYWTDGNYISALENFASLILTNESRKIDRISSDQVLFFVGDIAPMSVLAEIVCSIANDDYPAKTLYEDISNYMLTGERK